MEHADGHRYFEGLAVAHVLGGLDDSEGRVFRSHLLECGNCRARVGELRAIAHDLADVERDERRVRAAQAIDTKRRESEDETDEPVEPPASPRSSRITVIVGLVLIIGLSLWNFTLRGALTVQETHNRSLIAMGVITETGQEWEVVRSAADVDGTVKSKAGEFVVTVDGLDETQLYGLYVQNGAGVVAAQYEFQPDRGRLHQVFKLQGDATRITITDPEDRDGRVARPGNTPTGDYVFEAIKPSS
jgi:hypothetical protein